MILAESSGGGAWVLMGILVAALIFVAWILGQSSRRRSSVLTELERDRLEDQREVENRDSDAAVDLGRDRGVIAGEIPGRLTGAERIGADDADAGADSGSEPVPGDDPESPQGG